jgi:Gas vesicle synthesis protein GvpL/GvpF
VTLLSVYGLSDAPPAAALRGARGEPLRAEKIGPLFAVVGEVSEAPAISAEALRAHDAAVRRIADACEAFLPARFGSVGESLRGLEGREDALREALALVRGREQMTLRVYGDSPPPARSSGTAYLESLRASDALHDLDALREALRPMVRAERVETHRTEGLRASVYHLIERGTAPAYLEALRSVSLPVKVTPSGPWPAWSFAPEALR